MRKGLSAMERYYGIECTSSIEVSELGACSISVSLGICFRWIAIFSVSLSQALVVVVWKDITFVLVWNFQF